MSKTEINQTELITTLINQRNDGQNEFNSIKISKT